MDPKTIARAVAVILLGGTVLACAVELAHGKVALWILNVRGGR